MRAAGDALDLLAVDVDHRGRIAAPGPAVGGTDGLHDALCEDLGQAALQPAHHRQAEPVDADVVVFPERDRRLQGGLSLLARALSGQSATTIDRVALAEQ